MLTETSLQMKPGFSTVGLYISGELEIVFRVTQCHPLENLLDSKMLEKHLRCLSFQVSGIVAATLLFMLRPYLCNAVLVWV